MADDSVTVPIMDPNRGHRRWSLDEIYTGPDGSGRYVPNVNDEAFSWQTGLWRVIDVDYSTGLSTLQLYVPPKDPESINNEDVLLGSGPGTISESYRIYIDTSVTPHTLAIDSRLHFYGTGNVGVRYYRGSDIENDDNIISAMYDQAGTLLGDMIPLELVMVPTDSGVTNEAVQTPAVGYSNQKLQDNEVVTCVAYNEAGGVTSIARVLVTNTAYIRTTDESRKYITSIHMESPFLSESDDSLLQIPVNLPLSALDLKGVVTYSDGSRMELPVDGTKFSLYGIKNFVSTQVGQHIDLVLNYGLSAEEYIYGASVAGERFKAEPYSATTTQVDGAYTVKLFAVPVWVNAIEGYRLRWFMYTLDREIVYEVTDYIEFGINSRAFNPLEYGTLQNLSVAVDMKRVDAAFSAYRHTQTIGIALMSAGNLDQTNWTIEYSPGQAPVYGTNFRASQTFVNVNNWVFNLNSGFSSQTTWLEALYFRSQPIKHPTTELAPPTPNFFVLVVGNNRIEAPIDQWNADIVVPIGLNDGDVVLIEFIYRNASTDLQLGIAALPVHQEAPVG